jgi:hypothetical protein
LRLAVLCCYVLALRTLTAGVLGWHGHQQAAAPLRLVLQLPTQLERTGVQDGAIQPGLDYATYCPYKGDCNYYSVPAGGKKSVNAVWTYENPYPAVAQIKGHVAFYPDRVDEIAEQLPTTRESSKSSHTKKG